MTALSRKRLIDKLVEAYVDWREACVRVDDAYRALCARNWPVGCSRVRAVWLDGEEQAADAYAGLVRRAEKLPWPHKRRLEPLGEPVRGSDSALVDAQYESE
jgi:hypothetical protein